MAFFMNGLSGNWLVFFITLANAGTFVCIQQIHELESLQFSSIDGLVWLRSSERPILIELFATLTLIHRACSLVS
jgi:hypothetical protein